MTCYRSRDSWHSYVKHCLSEKDLNEMTSHLSHCPECREIVFDIRKTFDKLSKNKVTLNPPLDIKVNIMEAIDKNRYKQNLVSINTFRLFELRNWGLSMIAAGVFLFALNLTSLNPITRTEEMNELHELSKQIAIPLDKMSQAAANFFQRLNP